MLSSASFRRKAEKSFFTQWVARRQANRLFRLASGFIHSQVLVACLRLGLLEHLRDGPQELPAIAGELGIPPGRAQHLLRAAAALELVEERDPGVYGLGMLGAALCDNESVTAMVEHHSILYADLADPVALFADPDVETGLGKLWPYAPGGRSGGLTPHDVESYTALMAASQAMIAGQVLDAYPLDQAGTLLDLGGGAGAFVTAAVRRWPGLRARVVDLPAVAEIARERIAAEGLSGRIEVLGVDATREPLPGGNDVVSLVRVLHDHDDEKALALLNAARTALAPGGHLLVAEPMAGRRGAGPLVDAYFQVYLLAMGSGRPRNRSEQEALLRAAGFRHVGRRRTALPLITSVLVARP